MLAPFLIPNFLLEVDLLFSPAKFLVWTGTELLPAKKRLVSQPDPVHLVHLLLAGHYHPHCLWKTKRPFLHIYAIFYGIMDATSAFILWHVTKMIFGTKDWYRESRDGIPHYQSSTIQLCPGVGEDMEEWEEGQEVWILKVCVLTCILFHLFLSDWSFSFHTHRRQLLSSPECSSICCKPWWFCKSCAELCELVYLWCSPDHFSVWSFTGSSGKPACLRKKNVPFSVSSAN